MVAVPRLAGAARATVVATALLLAGCASGRIAIPDPDHLPDFGQVAVVARPEVAPAAAAGLAEARRLAGLGRRGEACTRLRDVLTDHPDFLDGDRYLQDLLAGTRSDAWLKGRYEARRAANPGDADAIYLAGRIEASRSRQAQLFRDALDADPAHPWARLGRAITLERSGRVEDAVREAWRTAAEAPWFAAPWFYLGATAWTRGAPDAAERFLREAIARAPEDVRAWIALAGAYDDLGRPEDASRAAVEAVRRAPGDPMALWSMGRLLERIGRRADIETALELVGPARAAAARPEDVEAFRGRMLVALGRYEEAESTLVEARRLGAPVGGTAVPLRRARVGAGHIREAVLEYLAELPGDVLSPGDLRAPAWRELIAASASGNRDRVLRALAAVGWIECADCLPETPLVRDSLDDPAPAAPARDDFPAFLRDLGDYARELGRRHKRGDKVPLGVVVAKVQELAAARSCGDTATEGLKVNSYALLGSFAMSADSEGCFRALFEDHGLLLVVGQRSGQGAEILLGRLVSDRRGLRADVLGQEVVYDERWIESEGLPEGLAGIRGGLAGLTLDRFVTLQLDVIRRGAPHEDSGLPYVPRLATDDAARRALDTPSDVARRIEAGLATGREPADRYEIDAVRRHELVHVVDAYRLLPPLEHPFAALWFALSHGFSAARMEQTLEARAAVGALVDAGEPRAALASLLAFLPAEDGETPHVVGYRRAVETAIDEIVRRPADFPSIDQRWNVLQQFDRLTPQEIRELGRRVARRMD